MATADMAYLVSSKATFTSSSCLICGVKCGVFNGKATFPNSRCPPLSGDLHVYVMLKYVYELPNNLLESYLKRGRGPRWWIRFCKSCTESFVVKCFKLHQQLLEVTRKLDKMKREVVKLTRQSAELVNTPGDRRAREAPCHDARLFIKSHCYTENDVKQEPDQKTCLSSDVADKLALGMLYMTKIVRNSRGSSLNQDKCVSGSNAPAVRDKDKEPSAASPSSSNESLKDVGSQFPEKLFCDESVEENRPVADLSSASNRSSGEGGPQSHALSFIDESPGEHGPVSPSSSCSNHMHVNEDRTQFFRQATPHQPVSRTCPDEANPMAPASSRPSHPISTASFNEDDGASDEEPELKAFLEDLPPPNAPQKAPESAPVPKVARITKATENLLHDNLYKCFSCGWKPDSSSTSPKDDLKAHAKNAHDLSELFTCPRCRKPFPNYSDLRLHMKSRLVKPTATAPHPPDPITPKSVFYKCDQCPKKFKTLDNLATHTQRSHKVTHLCSQCPWKSTNLVKMAEHRLSHDRLSCRRCHREMDRKSYRRHHTLCKIHHSRNRDITCDKCGKVFPHGGGFFSHYSTKHQPRVMLFNCDRCDKPFSHLSGLSQHLKHCQMEKDLAPQEKIQRKVELSEEQKRRFREKQKIKYSGYQACSHCGRMMRRSYLDSHVKLMHTQEYVKKRFCEICGKGVTRVGPHKVQVHDICGVASCNKQCEDKEDLYKHQIEVHKKESYLLKCDQCGKKFVGRNKLRNHLESHAVKEGRLTAKPFICEICGKGFHLKTNLGCHIFDAHRRTAKRVRNKTK